jgi:two-component system, OmpR family, phosphate regulon sensor histidine kinase PhoR
MRTRRLLWRIYPAHLILTLAFLVAVGWYASAALHRFYLDDNADDLAARAVLVEADFQNALAAGKSERVDALCKQFGRETATRFTFILPDGKVLGDTDESPQNMDNHADRPEVAAVLAGQPRGTSRRYSYTLKESRQYVAVPLRRDGKILGVLRTSVSLSALEDTLSAVRLRIAEICLLAALLAAGLSLLISRWQIRPLEILIRGAERFARGDLSHRLAVGAPGEIGALAETLNQMAAALDDKIRTVIRQGHEQEAILSSMVEGVLAVDCQERLLRLNRAAADLIGADPEKAQGRMIQEVVRNRELQQLIAGVLSTHQPKEENIVLHNKGDRYLQAHGTVLRDDEGEIGALVILHEVTQLKRLEKVRRDFVANVSHELRTPVTSIKGFVETLLDGAMHQPEDLQRFLQIVAVQTDRLNAIIEDLLTLSRIEEDEERSEIPLSQDSVHHVLQTALEVCGFRAAEKNLRLELDCDRNLQAAMNAPLLEQAVINLLDNAVKYSPAGQTVRLEAERTADEVVIRVIDHGCGISRDHLPRIFERFYRVDKARSRKLGGTGLGLAIVKHIAQVHGGRAEVESTVGQGSVFSIHLPAESAVAGKALEAELDRRFADREGSVAWSDLRAEGYGGRNEAPPSSPLGQKS